MISTFYLGTDSAENYGIIMTAPPPDVKIGAKTFQKKSQKNKPYKAFSQFCEPT